MESYRTLETLEGYSFDVKTSQIDGVTINMTLMNLEQPENTAYWRKYVAGFINDITEQLLKQTTQVIFRLSATGRYQSSDSDDITEPIPMVSNWAPKFFRHSADRFDKIEKNLSFIFDPDNYHATYQANGGGSKVAEIKDIQMISLSFDFPFVYNANALSTSYRLHGGVLPINAIKYMPYNSDIYCIMHCIFNKEQPKRKSLNEDKEYMERFNEWFEVNKLDRFYDGTFFILDKIADLEKQLDVNLNIYTIEKKNREENYPALHYRSAYNQDIDNILNLVIIPMDCFYNNRKTVPKPPKKMKQVIEVDYDDDAAYSAKINIKEFIWNNKAHCGVLDLPVFNIRDSDGVKRREKICRFCTKGLRDDRMLQEHEEKCLAFHQGSNSVMRTRTYKELRDPKKVFNNYQAFYRTPFCTFDFETRLSETNEHIPLSYSILYVNLFDLKKSKTVLKLNHDPEILLNDFCEDLISMTKHHRDLQNVDLYDPEDFAGIERPEKCPWCLNVGTDYDWNHTHFEGDNLNKHLDCYVCHDCNAKVTLKNKPLKFYAHNGSKFDFSLILSKLLNDGMFTNFEFLAKTESRFTQVVCAVSKDKTLKLSFNDSMMILGGSLASLANAWIKPEDKPKIKDLLNLFYPKNKNNIDPLVNISTGKQVFPYSALNEERYLDMKIIEKEVFYNVLNSSHIEDADYNVYLEASKILEEYTGSEYNFKHYHNFYLQLDVILLALVLLNFSEVCYTMNKLNPLTYLSISSYSFGALLKNNKYCRVEQPTLMVPKIEVQKFLQKSIKGGFTHIFNKQIPNFDKEKGVCSYFDVNSLYPSVMATKKLPYEFVDWMEGETKDLLNKMKEQSEDHYFFVECDIAPLEEKYQEKVSRYPMFPETFTVLPEHLSEDQLYRFYIGKGKELVEETINTVTFYEKKNYHCSYSYLKQALEVGYKVTKIHRVARFKSDYIMQDYVKKIYQLKKDASIEKDNLNKEDPEYKVKASALDSRIIAYKILLNGLYGSTIVNQEKHSETEVFDSTETDRLRKNISSFRYKSLLHLDQKVLVNKHKGSYKLEYPLSLGSAILFESKLIIAKFIFTFYDWLEKEFGLTFDAIMTDTDSYIFHIKDFKECFESIDQMCYFFNKECYSAFDTTFSAKAYQQPDTHQAFCHFKNETKGVPIIEYNGIAAKCYSYEKADAGGCVKGKGIAAAMQKKYLKNELYRRIINGDIFKDYLLKDEDGNVKTNPKYICNFTNIASKKMKLTNTQVSKNYVSLVDIKNYYGENGIEYSIFGSKKHLDQISD